MGRWGSNVVTRGRWDVDGFEAHARQFVTGVKDGRVSFGYVGQRTADIAGDIPVEHARRFYGYASRISESSWSKDCSRAARPTMRPNASRARSST